jgi:outer membrane receptor protein involved in Fe transport
MQLFQQTPGQIGAETTAAAQRQNNPELLVIPGNSVSLDSGDLNNTYFLQQLADTARQMGFQLESLQQLAEQVRAGIRGEGPGGAALAGGLGGGAGRGALLAGLVAMAGRGGRGAAFKQPKIQGNVSETFSNSALNARAYSLTGEELPKPVQIGNNYSVTLGGVLPFIKPSTPVNRGGGLLANLIGGGQPGWTFTYSGSRNRGADDILTTVPTDLERAGDFSQSSLRSGPLASQPVQLYDPASSGPRLFQNAQIPIDRMNPGSLALLKYFPRANLPGTTQNYALERSLPGTSDQIQGSVTGLRLTPKDNVSINYAFRRGTGLSAGIFPGLDSNRKNRGQNLAISSIHTFKPRLIGAWRVAWNRTRTEATNDFAYNQNVEGALGIAGTSLEPINWGIPNIGFTNYGDLSLAAPSVNRNQTLSITGGMTRIGTKHTLTIGGDANWNQRNSMTDSNARGTFSFTGYSTSAFDAKGRPIAGTGNDFADFLLGLPYSTSRRYGSSNNYLRNRTYSLFVQDNWRFRSGLTLNLGLRYEYTGPTFEKYNHLVSLDVAPGFAAVAQVLPNQEGPLSGLHFPRSIVGADRNNLGPRIGIAWKPTPKSKFVFRTGYGIFYNASAYSTIISQLIGQPPFAVNQDILTTRSNPLTLQNGFPASPDVTILNTYAIDPNYKPAYVQQWNLDVQAQISQLYVLDVAYNGSKGTGLDMLRAPNLSTSLLSNAGNFVYQTNGACSILHAMNVTLTRRFSHGFNVNNTYTLSKSIDDASGIGGGLIVAQNDANLAAERSRSSFDQRHNFSTTFSYELPVGQNRKFFANASAKVLNFIAGWNINGSFTLAGGTPLTARILGNVSNNTGTAKGANNSLRADATGLPVSLPWTGRTSAQFFNTQAFAIPSPGQYGNAGRNTITGPGSNLINLSMRKSFRLDEHGRRIDFFWAVSNVLNHPNWASVGTAVNALNFGVVAGLRQMRAMTMNLRFSF